MTWERRRQRLVVLVLLVTVVGIGAWASAADDVSTWIQTFEGPDYGAFFDVVSTADGAILVVGTTHHPLDVTTLGDVLIAKLSLSGGLIWETTYGGDATDQAFCVTATGDGGFLVLAETDSLGAGNRDLYALKVDASGALIWEETYGGAETEWAKDLIPISSGGFLLVGETDSFGESFDAYLVRIDEDGDVLWEATLGGTDNETGIAALEAENSDLLVLVGVSYPGGYEGSRRDASLYRIDSDGNEIWSMLYRGDDKQWPNDMIFSPDGDLVIVGIAEAVSRSQQPLDFWFAKADAETGELIWSAREGFQQQDDYGVSVALIPGGGYLVAGFGPGFPMMQFDDQGAVAWVRNALPERKWVIYGGFSILGLGDGTFLVPGWVYVRRVGDDFDAILARIDSEGWISE